MPDIAIRFTWITRTALSVHTGVARAGDVDRVVRERGGQPLLPGEAVKGAIREAAERLLRWQSEITESEKEDRSIPQHPALLRIFASDWASGPEASPARYFFRAAEGPHGARFETSSTAIETETGVADDDTLRRLEVWQPGTTFHLEIQGRFGNWTKDHRDYDDLFLLLEAIVAADAIGGDLAIGRGEVTLEDISVTGHVQISKHDLLTQWSDAAEPAQELPA